MTQLQMTMFMTIILLGAFLVGTDHCIHGSTPQDLSDVLEMF